MNRIEEIISEIPAEDISCHKHRDINAYCLCSECGKGICRDCIASGEDSWRLLCCSCTAKRRKMTFAQMLKALKYPVLWVMLCIFVAAAAFAAGLGNPSMERIRKEDSGRPWFRRQAGEIYLAQALRERSRAEALEAGGEVSDSRRWYAMSAEAFGLAADSWKDSPAQLPAEIAEALMLAKSGSPEKAISKLESMPVPQSSDLYSPWQFHIGLAYEFAGNNQKALESFKVSLENYRKKKSGFDLDALIEMAAKDNTEDIFSGKIRIVCGMEIPYEEILAKCGKKDPQENSEVPESEEKTGEDAGEGAADDKTGADEGFEIEIIRPGE